MNLNIFNICMTAFLSVSSVFAMETEGEERNHTAQISQVIAPALLKNVINGERVYETESHQYTVTWKTYQITDGDAQAQRAKEVQNNLQRGRFDATYAPILHVNKEIDEMIMNEFLSHNILISLNGISYNNRAPERKTYNTSVYTQAEAVANENWLIHFSFEETPK